MSSLILHPLIVYFLFLFHLRLILDSNSTVAPALEITQSIQLSGVHYMDLSSEGWACTYLIVSCLV